jgi:hypothetical protein
MPNDNVTFATSITPPKGAAAQSASRHTSKGTSTGPRPELPSILKKKKKLKLDGQLEPIRQLIESQPSVMQITPSKTDIALLLAMQTLRHK